MIDPISATLIFVWFLWQIWKLARAIRTLLNYDPIRANGKHPHLHARAEIEQALVSQARHYDEHARCTRFLDKQHARYAVSRTCRRPMRIALILN